MDHDDETTSRFTPEWDRILEAISYLTPKEYARVGLHEALSSEMVEEVERRRQARLSEVRRQAGRVTTDKKRQSSRANILKRNSQGNTELTKDKLAAAARRRYARESQERIEQAGGRCHVCKQEYPPDALRDYHIASGTYLVLCSNCMANLYSVEK